MLDGLAELAAAGGRLSWSTGLRSGEVAAAAGVNRQTLRYYERRGLLDAPARTLGGHRRYPPEAVSRLRVIKFAERLGFTLDEAAELITAGDLHGRLAAKLADVQDRITELTSVARTLRAALVAGCDDPLSCAEQRCPAVRNSA